MAKILFIYSTTTGNTQKVAKVVEDHLIKAGHKVSLEKAEELEVESISTFDACILASPTYAKGILHHHMARLAKNIGAMSFDVPFAVIGLGDIKWGEEHHIAAAGHLEKLVSGMGGSLLVDSLRIDGRPEKVLSTLVADWADQLAAALNS